ncbi:MAG: HAD-IIIC family phosphatase [Planctomycetota bacterium]|jgi:FkbH-like protein
MINKKFTDIQQEINNTSINNLQVYRISILRNIMLEPVVPYLKYLGLQNNLNCSVNFGEYDQIINDVSEGGIIKKDTPDCIMVFLNLQNFSPSLTTKFNSLSSNDIDTEVERVTGYINIVLNNIRTQTDAAILWFSFSLPLYPATGIADRQSELSQVKVINQLNEFITEKLKNLENSYCIDTNTLIARIGENDFFDYRYWHIGKAPYSRNALNEISCESFKYILALTGKSKKCLVLDCDNTLWGGIIGEDGLEGIKLSNTYPGSMYYELQEAILDLYNKGVILAVCSKNNEEDVKDVFLNHPDMVLKSDNISAWRVNWKDKASNIAELAEELNIGQDSLVFIDDSEFEINLVNSSLPEVTTILLDKNNMSKAAVNLQASSLFDTLTVTSEDKSRGAMYKAEADRRKLQKSSVSIDEYYKSLEMKLDISPADSFTIPRISQLTQKTNQFNLTTKRYSEAEIVSFSESDDYCVYSLKLSDKLGDSGLVGVAILKYEDKTALFDSFLLSCRVLGRGVEKAFINYCCNKCFADGIDTVKGVFIPTSKNSQTKDFYSSCGFEVKYSSSEEITFELDNKNNLCLTPEWLEE